MQITSTINIVNQLFKILVLSGKDILVRRIRTIKADTYLIKFVKALKTLISLHVGLTL